MKNPQTRVTEAAILRQKAEEQLKKKSSKKVSKLSEVDTLKLIHELQVHQIELELQNEELLLANERADRDKEKYSVLYDFAPSGYFTLTNEGKIIRANLKGAAMLGKERQRLINNMFGLYVSIETRPAFYLFLCNIFKDKDNESCEVTLSLKANDIQTEIYITGRIIENSDECQITIVDITKRKIAERALYVTNNMFQNLAKSVNSYVAYVNATTLKYEFVNDLFEKSFSIPKEKIIGSHIKDVIGETNYRFALKYIKEVKSGKPVSYENTFDISSGKRCLQVDYSPVFDANGKVVGIALVSYDITERKRSEEKLKGSEERLQKILDATPFPIALVDTQDTIIKYWSHSAISLFGYTAPTTDEWYKIAYPDEDYRRDVIERWKYFLGKARLSSQPVNTGEYRVTCSNGSVLICELYATFIEDNLIVTFNNITERKHAEEEFRSLAESMPQIVWTTRADGWNTYFNQQWVNYTGLMLEESYGQGWIKPFHPDDQKMALDAWQNAVDNNAEYSIECRLRCHDGTYHWWLIRGVPQIGDKGEIVKWFGTCTDIEKIKNAEIELKNKFKEVKSIYKDLQKSNAELITAKGKAEDSDRLKSAFLANMSHEIRTPMNGILGFTELLKEPNLSTDDQQDFIQTIQISGERMLNTINNIVDVSKIESGLINVNIDETNINKKIEFTYKFFKPEVEKKGLQFIFKNSLPTSDSVIKTDNEKVYGVLANLIKNAIKFTYDGSIKFGYEKKGAFLEFYVKDTGVGIPKNLHQTIFERFRQGSYELNRLYEGSGLGLSIAKSYVEMLGGKIWVESEEGKGSTFYFTIPYRTAEEAKTEIKGVDSSEIKEIQMKNLKILIVEDDEVSYSLLKRNIQKIGKEVLHAITGVETIEACRSNPDLDLVLMDIRMPIMDGIEATRQIRLFNKDVIIIAQTAYAFAGDSEKTMEAGCNDYITKPINMTALFELIKKHCNK